MREVKVVIFIIVGIFLLGFAKILLVFVFDMVSIAVPSDKHGVDAVNEGLKDGSEWFEKRIDRTPDEKRKAMNDAGLFYNPSTGEWEEDWEKYDAYLNAKTGYNPDRNR